MTDRNSPEDEERFRRGKLAMGLIMGDAVAAMFDNEDICFALKNMADSYDHALTLIQSYARDMQKAHLDETRGGVAQ
jgi:hypothetical protein